MFLDIELLCLEVIFFLELVVIIFVLLDNLVIIGWIYCFFKGVVCLKNYFYDNFVSGMYLGVLNMCVLLVKRGFFCIYVFLFLRNNLFE